MRARHVIILWYMFYMFSINVLYGVHHGDHSYGDHRVSLSINTLWQPERLTWSVYSITSVCSEMISYMLSCNCYSHMKLYFYDSCSTCYRSMLTATMRYCIVWGPYRDHWYRDHWYTSMSIWGAGIACLGVGGVDMYHYSRQVGVGLHYCDTYQLSLCVRSVVVITLSCNCRTESW